MLDYPVILGILTVALGVTVVITLLTAGLLPALVVAAVGVLTYFLLLRFGFVTFSLNKMGAHIGLHETVPTPNSNDHEQKQKHRTMQIKEVFYVEGEQYTFNDAPAVCAAYGAELASYDQVSEAFSLGAEWCGYGWSAGGMALFPTQESTWSAMQTNPDETKRTACGRPGVNGGYFDPRMKFGVNCYGTKPAGRPMKFPLPPPGTDTASFDKLVNKFKGMLHSMTVSPFNRITWSEKNEAAAVVKGAKSKGIFRTIGKDVEAL